MQRCFTKIDRAKPLDSKTVLIFSVRPERTSYELLMELMKIGRESNQVFCNFHRILMLMLVQIPFLWLLYAAGYSMLQ